MESETPRWTAVPFMTIDTPSTDACPHCHGNGYYTDETGMNSIDCECQRPVETPRRYMTVVYEITDETEWRKTNPLRYAHNGLSAFRVCVDDACELLDEAEAEVERLNKTLEDAIWEKHGLSEPTTPASEPSTDACPHCGAELYSFPNQSDETTYWRCGTRFSRCLKVYFRQSGSCYERQLAASKAEVERLREALDTLTLIVGLTPVAGNKETLQEAYDLARKALNPTEPTNKPSI